MAVYEPKSVVMSPNPKKVILEVTYDDDDHRFMFTYGNTVISVNTLEKEIEKWKLMMKCVEENREDWFTVLLDMEQAHSDCWFAVGYNNLEISCATATMEWSITIPLEQAIEALVKTTKILEYNAEKA